MSHLLSPASRASVVVPSYRRPEDLEACLRALSGQSCPALEILVVLRRDDEGSRQVASRAAHARIVEVDRPGQVAALNRGCEAARGELIAITDDDALPRPNWLEAIAARFDTDTSIGAVGGRDVVHVDDHVVDGYATSVGRVLWWGRRIGNHHLRSRLQDVHFLKGANMAFRQAALRPFDPHLRGEGAQVCNDLEASWSVRRRGWRVVYDPEVVVDHYPALRPSGGERSVTTVRAQCDEEHNELYALLLHAALWQQPLLLAHRLLMGSRRSPGLLLSAWPGLPTEQRASAVDLARARLAALRSIRDTRRVEPTPALRPCPPRSQ